MIPEYIIIPRQIIDEMIAHCKECYPNEACGILAGIDNEVKNIYKMTNVENSPVSYLMDPKEQFKVMKEIRTNNLSMLAIYHSHPSSVAYPSAKDMSLAFYEDAIYIILSLLEKEPILRCFNIRDGKIKEISYIIK